MVAHLLICKDCSDQFHVVDFSTAGVDGLQQLIHFLVAHFLAQVCQDVPQLAHSYEPGHVFVKNLEAAAVFFWFAGVSETARSVEYFAKRVKINCAQVNLCRLRK